MHNSNTRGTGLLMEWQQTRGTLVCSGDTNVIRLWDTNREVCAAEFQTEADSCVSSLTSDKLAGDIIVVGFGDGAIKVFDRRIAPKSGVVRIWEEHRNYVQGVKMQRGGARELVSCSVKGQVKFWDIRQSRSLQTIATHEPMEAETRAFDVHDFAQVFTT